MYIKKKVREQIDVINNYVDNCINSKEFKEFVENQKKYICIKNKNNCYCSNCKHEFEAVCKVNDYIQCPNCKKKLLVKRTSNYVDKDYFMYLINFNDKYIVRNYEIVSTYSNSTKSMKFIITEYARQVIEKDGTLNLKIMINNMRRNTSGYWYINYWEKTSYWKPECYIMIYGKCFVDKNTLKAKYYDPKEIFDNAEVDVAEILRGISKNDYALEILTKAKLYNLAAFYCDFKVGKFEDVFRLDKSYLNFMIENNITYKELCVLQKIKIKDYELVKYFCNVYHLDELLKYCKPYDLMKYHIKNKDIYMYLDYISMAKQQKMDLKDKSILYPKNLKEKHDELQHQIQVRKDKVITKQIKKRYEKIKTNEFQNKQYIIYPVKSVEELVEESSQQNNCVKTYAERVAKGQCDIYFMRLIKDINHSLVTVEVRENKVVQKRTKNNAATTNSQNIFLKKWENQILNKKV